MSKYPNNIMIVIEILALLNVAQHADWSMLHKAGWIIFIVLGWHYMLSHTPPGR